MLRFLSIHMLLAPLIALGGGLRLGRSSARLVDDATMEVTVDGVAQLALFEGQFWDGPFIQ